MVKMVEITIIIIIQIIIIMTIIIRMIIYIVLVDCLSVKKIIKKYVY